MFSKPSFQTYFNQVGSMVLKELDKETPEYLLQVDFDAYLEHLIDKMAWETLELDEASMTMEPFIAKRPTTTFGETFQIDKPQVRLRIPVSRHPQRREFFKLIPTTYRLSGEPDWVFQGDTLILETDANESAIETALEEARFWIGGRNTDVRNGNSRLRQIIEPIWQRKRQELEIHHGALSALAQRTKIPLHQSATAPKPIVVQKQKVSTPKPALKPGTPEPELDRNSVVEIVDFVQTYGQQIEVSPSVYAPLEEEKLRDLVLGMLNVNYPGSTGETFSKRGKTDLFLRAGGGGSLVVECKRWTGQKKYGEAVDQLFRYLTWRHAYGVLLTFSTKRDMTAVIDAAKEAIEDHATTVAGSVKGASSRFGSRHIHPQDRAKEVELFHLFVDLA